MRWEITKDMLFVVGIISLTTLLALGVKEMIKCKCQNVEQTVDAGVICNDVECSINESRKRDDKFRICISKCFKYECSKQRDSCILKCYDESRR